MEGLEVNMLVPDLWQQEAIRALQEGLDVVVDAPTGAGKTYIFEMFIQHGLDGRCVYTVPTRALANDKLLEWRAKGWNVGIATGDVADNLNAPVIVATLETQKQRLLQGIGPRLLVIDEYQMLGDRARGVNYELAIALAPPETQLLMLSGSVDNPQSVAEWLRRLDRQPQLISTKERPVPLDEIFIDSLRERIPDNIRGFWPRAIAKALVADMGPILVFAPRRASAEALARRISAALPIDEPLQLTPQQRKLAGDELARLLKNRVTYHHSGLSYLQRAGLIEPLAKTGQLRVVVATTGLGAGVNFNLRSVIVTDREYRTGDAYQLIRPDELKQMFGRAGRRGLDKRGFILVAQGKPRLSEARAIHLRRTNRVEWSSLIAFMHKASEEGTPPIEAARSLTRRLFSQQRVPLGLAELAENGYAEPREAPALKNEKPVKRRAVIEILNSRDLWERRRAPVRAPLGETLVRENDAWKPMLKSSATVKKIGLGRLCKLGDGKSFRYGREISLAAISDKPEVHGELILTKTFMRAIHEWQRNEPRKKKILKRGWTLERLEAELIPLLPRVTKGGELYELVERGGLINARLDYAKAMTFVYRDSEGQALLRPPERERQPDNFPGFRQMFGEVESKRADTVAEAWIQLGLINRHGRPTRRGILFSFFNHGEGLAVAAALEDDTYDIEEIVPALANLRAGHRFSEHANYSDRLGNTCRLVYRGATYAGYLNKGVPTDYGDGAAEIILELRKNPAIHHKLIGEELHHGDIERAELEWRSILNHIRHAPDYDWDRWRELKAACERTLGDYAYKDPFANIPELTLEQKRRYKRGLRF